MRNWYTRGFAVGQWRWCLYITVSDVQKRNPDVDHVYPVLVAVTMLP